MAALRAPTQIHPVTRIDRRSPRQPPLSRFSKRAPLEDAGPGRKNTPALKIKRRAWKQTATVVTAAFTGLIIVAPKAEAGNIPSNSNQITQALPSNPEDAHVLPQHTHANFKEGSKEEAKSSISAGLDMRGTQLSSTSKCKGLKNLKKGRFDQLWMVKWFDWYKYVVAMTRRAWDISNVAANKLMSATVRAENAKIAHAA